MKRRGFLGALLGGMAAPFIAPLAVAAPAVDWTSLANVKPQKFEPAFHETFASSTEETNLADKINAMAPDSRLGRGYTRCFTHIDEMAWFDAKGTP